MKVDTELLEWSDDFATGIDLIDQQHKILIGMLNQANLCFRSEENHEVQMQLIEDLLGYTVYHFNTEEELMDENAYGDSHPDEENTHISEHRSFTSKIYEYQSALRHHEVVECHALFNFLNSWLINHVLKTDKNLGKYLTECK